MTKTINSKSIKQVLFFATVWIFYSLNSKYLRIPNAMVLRWVFLAITIVFAIIETGKVDLIPPSIIFVFIIGVVPSLFVSISQTESFVKFLSFIIVVWGSYVYFRLLNTKEDLVFAFKTILIVIILFEIQSIVCILLGVGYMGDRANGITANPNTLGIYSNLSILASYYYAKNTKGLKRAFFILMVGLSIYTAIASGSRSALVSLFLNMSIIILFLSKGKIWGFFSIFLIAVSAYLALNGKLAFLNIDSLNRLLEKGGASRGALWEKGIQVWKDHPIFGCGYAVSEYLNDIDLETGYYAFHNSYISILAETGIWGAFWIGIGVISGLFHDVKQSYIEIKTGDTNNVFICLCLLVTLLINAYAESFLFAVGSTEACTFWLLFTWSLVCVQFDKKEPTKIVERLGTNAEE